VVSVADFLRMDNPQPQTADVRQVKLGIALVATLVRAAEITREDAR
jgi:hypothetical protein